MHRPGPQGLSGYGPSEESDSRLRLAEVAPSATAPLPTTALNSVPELVNDLGGDVSALLSSAGIAEAIVDRPGKRIPFMTAAALFDDAARQLDCADFGMRLGRRQEPVRRFKPLVGVITNAATIGEVIDWSVSHGHAFTTSFRSTRVFDPKRKLHALRYHMPGDGLPIFGQVTENVLTLTTRALTELSGSVARPREIWFSHKPFSEPAHYRAVFDAPVKFGQEFDAIFFNDGDVTAPVVDADREAYQREAAAILKRIPSDPELFELQVRETIRVLLLEGGCSRADVARAMDIGSRTLNRKISARGKTFGEVRDEVRRSLALRYLLSPGIPFSLISARLGYAELSVFSRSCQRWFGASPRDLRHRLIAIAGEVI